jgi:hypothetical protein
MPRDYRRADTYTTVAPEEPTGPPCPGTCNTAWRAAERHATDSGIPHSLQPHHGDPVWCTACHTRIRGALADLADLAQLLADEIVSGVSAALTEYVSGSKTRPIHDHEAPSFLLDEIAEWLGAREDTIRRGRDLAGRIDHRNPISAILASTSFLTTHLDWALVHGADTDTPDVLGAQILHYQRRAQLLTGAADPEPVRIDGVACPLCDRCCLEHELEQGTRRARLSTYLLDPAGRHVHYQGPHPLRDETWTNRRVTTTAPTSLTGALTGYIACRRCKPVFRMAPVEYDRWTGMLARDACARGYAPVEKLTLVFGGQIPPMFLDAARRFEAELAMLGTVCL